MIEQVVNRRNMHLAYKQVLANKGSAGVDGMPVSELKPFIRKEREAIVLSMINGSYLPQPILGVNIPKPGGKTRLLGIPTVTERWLQQAVAEAITPLFEFGFKDHSYGFRPGKNAHQCIQQSQHYIGEGYGHIVDIDLKSFFDEVDHCLLLQLLYRKVKCPLTLRLIRKWLRAPMLINGKLTKRRKGVPQGSPLALRTHLQTLSFQGGLQLSGVDFNTFIRSITFMINGKSTEPGTGHAYQRGIYLTSKRKAAAANCNVVKAEVWCLTDTGLSLHQAGQGNQRKNGGAGAFCRLYGKVATDAGPTDKEAIGIQEVIDQQSGSYGAGRIFSWQGSCPKRRNRLRCHLPMTGCGNKSSHRCTICLCQPVLFSRNPLHMNEYSKRQFMKTAAIYTRVSSDQQKEKKTIDSQVDELVQFAREQGYVVPEQYIFRDEGYSGAILVRPGLEKVRDLSAEGQIQAVLIHSPDRLSRNYAYQVVLIDEFTSCNTEVLFINSPKADTPEEALLLQFQGMISEYERAIIKERTRRGKRFKAKSGVVNVLCGAPYGYTYIKKTEETAAYYQINEKEATL
jgi:DNA invertase Pin-like site-specific DNA recombinase